MTRTYVELMNELMADSATDIVPADDFVQRGFAALTAQGNELTQQSAKNNLLNHRKLDDAGLVKISIGRSEFVASTEAANNLLTGGAINVVGSSTSPTEQPTATPEGGSFYGIPRADDPENELFATMIPKKIGFVESGDREFRTLANAYKRRKHIMLEGPTGSGKTALANDFCAELNKPMIRVNCSEGMDEFQLVGHMTKNKSGEVIFVPGFIHMAMKYGITIVLDEVNSLDEAVATILHGVMDFGYLSIPYNDNEILHAHPDFFVIGCINPPEDYAGMKEMNQATLSRFRWIEQVGYLPEDKEVEVVMAQAGVNNPMVARTLVRLANDVRASKKAGDIGWDCSTRNLIDCLSFSTDEPLPKAIRATLVNRCPPIDRDVVDRAAAARVSGYDA